MYHRSKESWLVLEGFSLFYLQKPLHQDDDAKDDAAGKYQSVSSNFDVFLSLVDA